MPQIPLNAIKDCSSLSSQFAFVERAKKAKKPSKTNKTKKSEMSLTVAEDCLSYYFIQPHQLSRKG
jgi:hypothetical protein